MKFLFAAVILAVLVFVFIFTYLLNKRTPKPEGCENIDGECEGCRITSCINHPDNEKEDF